MIKGAIFDIDGTVLNSMPVWENLGEIYLKSLGIEAEKNLGDVLFTMSMQQGAEYMIENYHLTQTPEQVIEGINKEISQFYSERVPLKEGVRSFLEGLRDEGVTMMIATSSDRKNIEAALRRLHVWNLFSGMLTCSELQTDKNRPDIYLSAALQMDCDPGEVLVFEDACHAIQTTKKAGFFTVAVYDKSNDRQLAKIWNTADLYLAEYGDFTSFWSKIRKIQKARKK